MKPEDTYRVHLEYRIAKVGEDFYQEPTQAELDGGYRDTGPFVALMPGKWNNWNFEKHPEVVTRDAHTFMEQEDGEPAYITLGHTNSPRDRIGFLTQSEPQDNKVIQRARITHPEGVKLYDAKLLGKRVSIEADADIDLKNSTPDDLIVLGYQGTGTAIVKRPACVTCPKVALELVLEKLGEYQNIKLEGENVSEDKKQAGDQTPEPITEEKVTGIVQKALSGFAEAFGIKKPEANLEDDEKDIEGDVNLEGKTPEDEEKEDITLEEENAQKIVELEEQNKKYKLYFEKQMKLNAQKEREEIELKHKELADKFKVELEEDYYKEKDNVELQGEIAAYTAMLDKFPDGDIPIVLDSNKKESVDKDLEKEVAELEKELGSTPTVVEL